MTEPYRTFHIAGGAEPSLETLLGRITAWYASGSSDYRRTDRSVVELMRFRLSCVRFADEQTAKMFGVELARVSWIAAIAIND
jgi:hypothetical protein